MVTYQFERDGKPIKISVSNKSQRLFDANHGPGNQRRFFRQLVSTGQPIAEIGRRFGMTREAAWLRYHRWVEPSLGLSGRERRREFPTEQRVYLKPVPKALSLVTRAATRQGLTVAPSFVIYQSTVLKRHVQQKGALVINQRRCRVRIAQTVWKKYLACFSVSQAAASKFDFYIFVYTPLKGSPILFIVPSRVLISLKGTRITQLIYLPTRPKPNRRGRPPHNDWEQYRDAWRLIK